MIERESNRRSRSTRCSVIASAGSLVVICASTKGKDGERGEAGRGVTRPAEASREVSGTYVRRASYGFWCSQGEPEAAILEKKRESGVPLFCVPRQRRSSQPENVSSSLLHVQRASLVHPPYTCNSRSRRRGVGRNTDK